MDNQETTLGTRHRTKKNNREHWKGWATGDNPGVSDKGKTKLHVNGNR